jgi:hypothetical protein
VQHFEFCRDMMNHLGADGTCLSKIYFSDEATSHLSRIVNRHNAGLWGSENPHDIIEHVRDSLNVNAFCDMTSDTVYGPFSLLEQKPNVVFQHDGAPLHI